VPCRQQLVRRYAELGLEVVADPSATGSDSQRTPRRSAPGKRPCGRARRERSRRARPASRPVRRRPAAKNDQVGKLDTFLPPLAAPLKAVWMPAGVSSTFANWAGWLTSTLLRLETDARSVRPAALVGAAEGCSRAQAAPISSAMESPEATILALRSAMSQRRSACDRRRERILPNQLLRRHLRPR
jgi:hypothetical protein